MVYESRIDFTFDTICPWYVVLPPTTPTTHPRNPCPVSAFPHPLSSSSYPVHDTSSALTRSKPPSNVRTQHRTYLAKTRLDRALSSFTSDKITFTRNYSPYLLYPKATSEGQDKRNWYTANRYNQSPDQMAKYETVMQSLGEAEGINFDFGGEIAGTLDAHRVIRYFQSKKGPEVAGRVLDHLYRAYFEGAKHPSSRETLLAACAGAGIAEAEAKAVVEHAEVGREEVLEAIREARGNGVDSVPVVTIEGRRRDFTLEGAKTVEEYVKALEQVAKESS